MNLQHAPLCLFCLNFFPRSRESHACLAILLDFAGLWRPVILCSGARFPVTFFSSPPEYPFLETRGPKVGIRQFCTISFSQRPSDGLIFFSPLVPCRVMAKRHPLGFSLPRLIYLFFWSLVTNSCWSTTATFSECSLTDSALIRRYERWMPFQAILPFFFFFPSPPSAIWNSEGLEGKARAITLSLFLSSCPPFFPQTAPFF